MKIRYFLASGLVGLASLAQADTADDCIADYQAVKAQFESASADGLYECVRLARALNLIATGSSPAECTGEDEWHLEAKSVVGNPGQCQTRILGSEGANCEAELMTRELAPDEAARWQNFLFAECRELGDIKGLGQPAE